MTSDNQRCLIFFLILINLQGLFNKPELTTFEGFYTLKDQAIEATDRLIEEATNSPTHPMVEIFDELSDTLCKVADLAEFVRIAHPQPHFARAAEEACISISGVVEKYVFVLSIINYANNHSQENLTV